MPAPLRQMPWGGEPAHVGSRLGDDGVDHQPVEPGDGQQQFPGRLVGGGPQIDLLAQCRDGGVEEVDVVQDPAGSHRVMGAEVPVECFCQFRDLRTELALGQIGKLGWVALPVDERTPSPPPGLRDEIQRRGKGHN